MASPARPIMIYKQYFKERGRWKPFRAGLNTKEQEEERRRRRLSRLIGLRAGWSHRGPRRYEWGRPGGDADAAEEKGDGRGPSRFFPSDPAAASSPAAKRNDEEGSRRLWQRLASPPLTDRPTDRPPPLPPPPSPQRQGAASSGPQANKRGPHWRSATARPSGPLIGCRLQGLTGPPEPARCPLASGREKEKGRGYRRRRSAARPVRLAWPPARLGLAGEGEGEGYHYCCSGLS